jgi:spore coat polysaccharide biosynthesis protein SpsF (cytidylyltransferase family)
MANPLMQPGLDPLQGIRHQKFANFYRDPTLDPFQGDYAQVMERFDPEVNKCIVTRVIVRTSGK